MQNGKGDIFLLYVKILKDSHTDMATISVAVCFVSLIMTALQEKGLYVSTTCVCVCVCRWRQLGWRSLCI